MNDKKIVYDLQDIIKENRFFLIYDLESERLELKILELIKKGDKQIDMWTCNERCSDYSFVRCISQEQMDTLKKQFYLYEFTDKGICLDMKNTFPTILNYIKQGILSEDELLESLLYKIG